MYINVRPATGVEHANHAGNNVGSDGTSTPEPEEEEDRMLSADFFARMDILHRQQRALMDPEGA